MYPVFRKRSSKDSLAIEISEEEHKFILEKERKFKELGIDVWGMLQRILQIGKTGVIEPEFVNPSGRRYFTSEQVDAYFRGEYSNKGGV